MELAEFTFSATGGNRLANGAPALTLSIGAPHLYITIWIADAELPLLDGIEHADWDARKSVCLGRCAGSPVFWSSTAKDLTLLVGSDDECWDVALTLPLAALAAIRAEIAHERALRKP